MDVSHESPARTEERLSRVLAHADIEVQPGEYVFREFPLAAFPARLGDTALALVRDHDVWSALVPAEPARAGHDGSERFVVFSIHFVAGQDNSGFVGWLASRLKRALGTGVFVVCGQNSRRGGIFDHWGVPADLGAQAIAEVQRMRGEVDAA
jgi:hypothetical protein